MRYELSDYESTAIKLTLPNKLRGVRRVNDRRVLNGIFWVLRSGAPWRDLRTGSGSFARQQGAWANIPPKRNRKEPICFSSHLYRTRNLIERFFNKITRGQLPTIRQTRINPRLAAR